MQCLTPAIESTFEDCLKVRKTETVLILADDPLSELGYQFYEKAKLISKKSSLLILPEIKNHGYEPSKAVESIMIRSDIIILLTQRSISHTISRRKATQHGARIISLPGIIPEALIRTMDRNYKSMIDKSRKLADILTIGRSAKLTTAAGTNLTFSLSRMKGYADTGMVHEPGQFSNLPSGEGSAAPVQGTTHGLLVIDGSFPEVGLMKNPVRMSVREGHVMRITGGKEAEKIRSLLRPFGKQGRNIAEIGIGTNPKAKLTGCIVEDEKVLGTVHVALGNNVSFGGKVSATPGNRCAQIGCLQT